MKPYVKSLLEMEKKKTRKKHRRLALFTLIVTFSVYRMVFSLILMSSNITITAHRGSTTIAPENTIASVLEAIALDVDYIEIDVQLSKDNKVFLLHDASFKRTAGVPVRPWDLKYEEIQALNVGNYKKTTLFYEAPLLEDVIKVGSLSDVKLNIELKNYGHSGRLPYEVISILKENDFLNRCVITSNSRAMLKEVRKIEPQARIGLITASSSLTTYLQNNFVDFFSINYLAISPRITLYVHSMGKEIFCWTPNNGVSIESAIRAGADNIITNNITLTKLMIITTK